jgi:signal transduction histidine kinase/CheY-like chemotaxis protein/PAS domain-containing protein
MGKHHASNLNSIRTRYSLATAGLLLVILALFFVGGRIAIVRLMRDAERKVKEIGRDISNIVYTNAKKSRNATSGCVEYVLMMMNTGRSPDEILSSFYSLNLALAVHCRPDGSFISGVAGVGNDDVSLVASDLTPYVSVLSKWAESIDNGDNGNDSVGIVMVRGGTFYASLMRSVTGDLVILGTPFDTKAFSSEVSGRYGVVGKDAADGGGDIRHQSVTEDRNAKGLAPMLSEALNFDPDGFWGSDQDPFQAVFAVRDIAGNSVAMIMMSVPQTLSMAAGSVIVRLMLFVSLIGTMIILPLFWLQGRILLDPLAKMTAAIRDLGDRHMDSDCPRVEWKGEDEFALLASSVNRMLETISARTVRLAQLEVRQRALIDGFPDALVVFDRSGRIVSIYKQPSVSEPIPGFVKRSVPAMDVYGNEQIDIFKKRLESTFTGRGIATMRFCSGDPGAANARHFEMRLARMDDLFVLGLIRDVTPEVAEHRLRIAAEKRAVDASKHESLTLLAAGIAHDVNNILAVILNTVETAHAAVDSRTRSDALVAVRDAVKRGSAMTKELMTFAGETKTALEPRSPSNIVCEIRRLAERTLGSNVSVSYSLADGLPDIDVDPNQFWKVLFNIVKNAGEAIGDNPGHITLATQSFDMTEDAASGFASEHPIRPGRGVIFKITDDGPGINKEMLPRIFDPYVSSHTTGRGLGLAIVRAVIDMHGGGIKVESEIGRGTTFLIYLPESRLSKSKVAMQVPPAPSKGAVARDVLVVDNDEAILKTCAILLRSIGIVPHVARTRNEALGVLRRGPERIGAVLLDANLGAIDTVRLLEAMRSAVPSLRVVISSGSNEEDIRKMFDSGSFDAFLAKPYTIAELKNALA